MGDDIQNIKNTAEDLAVERAEQQLADPSALNMQFLQSTLNTSEFEGLSAHSGFPGAAAKSQLHQSNQSSGSFSGLSPAYSGAGLLGAVGAADLSGASSAMGMAAQVASAAPVTFGKPLWASLQVWRLWGIGLCRSPLTCQKFLIFLC